MYSTSTHQTPKKPLTGSCSCGLICWSITSPVTKATFCHCKTCRHISGAPFLALASRVPTNTVTWTCRSNSALGAPTSPSEHSHSTSMSSSLPPEIASVVESMTFRTDRHSRACILQELPHQSLHGIFLPLRGGQPRFGNDERLRV